MDLYHLWFNAKPEIGDLELCERLHTYLGHLVDAGRIESFRITRKKLGLGAASLADFHVMIEVRDLAQLDQAFVLVASRSDPVESLHAAVNQYVTDFSAALYRDFPDPGRQRGQEKF